MAIPDEDTVTVMRRYAIRRQGQGAVEIMRAVESKGIHFFLRGDIPDKDRPILPARRKGIVAERHATDGIIQMT